MIERAAAAEADAAARRALRQRLAAARAAARTVDDEATAAAAALAGVRLFEELRQWIVLQSKVLHPDPPHCGVVRPQQCASKVRCEEQHNADPRTHPQLSELLRVH